MVEGRGRGRVRRAGLLAALVQLALATCARAETRVFLHYSGYWRAFRILTVESTSMMDDAAYRVEVTMRTEGVIDMLFPWRSRSESVGLMRDGAPVPRRVRSEGTFRSRTYRTALDYLDSGEIHVEVEPAPEADARAPVPEDLRQATIDPQSATLALIHRNATAESCAGREPVFDGRLRYDVDFTDRGIVTLEPSARVRYPGPARLCEAVVHPRAGFSRAEGSDGTRTTLRYWFAPVAAGIPPMPVMIDVSGRRGTLTLYLTEARAPSP